MLVYNLSMVKKQSLFQSKLFQATIMVSIILFSSGFFMSQSDKMFGKAASGMITGTMVLIDQKTDIIDDVEYQIALPKDTCTGMSNVCFGSTTLNTKCRSFPIKFIGSNLYSIPIGDVFTTQTISCDGGGSPTINFNDGLYSGAKFAYLTLNGYEWCVEEVFGSIALTSPPTTLSLGNPGGTCTGGRSASSIIDATAYTNLTGSISLICNGGSTSATGTVVLQRKLPDPLFHLSVAFSCPV